MRLLVFSILVAVIRCDYYANRAKILELESKLTVGGNTTLVGNESIVNECLMKRKLDEVNYGIHNPDFYNFSHHYFLYKDKIAQSKVYQIIKEMPKGALLHIHDLAILGSEYMLNLTYMDNLYVCLRKPVTFKFSNNVPNVTCDVPWQLMADVRRRTKNIASFDLKIMKQFTIVVKNPDVVNNGFTDTWNRLTNYFTTVRGLLTYRPVWKQYIYDSIKTFRQHNIMYAEIRTSLLNTYELNGTNFDSLETAKIYNDVINEFKKNHPDFFGVKLIFTTSRRFEGNIINSLIRTIKMISEKLPKLFVGMDLVGREDLGKPLIEFVSEFRALKDMDFFFHAGETNWYGTDIDENLVDAVLLGAKRIGHAYALTKHPVVMKELIERDIGIEVNVVSNAVLSLVKDVRNHPLSVFLSHGLPVVLSSDDPGAWGADPLSDDFYVAFVGVASKHSDLRMLKTLALNSLKYSALDSANKQLAINSFHSKWNNFIDMFDCSLY